jgi:hypothetical protein
LCLPGHQPGGRIDLPGDIGVIRNRHRRQGHQTG